MSAGGDPDAARGSRPGTEYQDPRGPGALVGALCTWQALVHAGTATEPQQLAFDFSCGSRHRAHRIAGLLRHRLDCRVSSVCPPRQHRCEAWRVTGLTRSKVQSLDELERQYTALRRASIHHQVVLTTLVLR